MNSSEAAVSRSRRRFQATSRNSSRSNSVVDSTIQRQSSTQTLRQSIALNQQSLQDQLLIAEIAQKQATAAETRARIERLKLKNVKLRARIRSTESNAL